MGEKYEKFFFNVNPNTWNYPDSTFHQIAIKAHTKNSHTKIETNIKYP